MSLYKSRHDQAALESWNARKSAPYRRISLKALSPALGVEVSGVDLKQELDPEVVDEIKRALADNLVLVFRDQPLDVAGHKRFARHFGQLHRHVLAEDTAALSARSEDAELFSWKTGRQTSYTAGDGWHSDVSCDAAPIRASFLRLTRLPENGGGDTAFVNLYLAYDSLSDPVKRLLEGLTAVHDGRCAWGRYGAESTAEKPFPANAHPVVARHPDTGRRFLFVNETFTSHIVELTRGESDALLQFLYRHIEGHLNFQVRVRWTPDSLVVWDNWAAQHHAVWDYFPFERWGERVSAYPEAGPQPAVAVPRRTSEAEPVAA